MVLALLKTWQNRDTQVASWTGQMPQIPQDEWLAGRQVVELDCFIIIARKQQVNRRGLVYDSPQDMTKPLAQGSQTQITLGPHLSMSF